MLAAKCRTPIPNRSRRQFKLSPREPVRYLRVLTGNTMMVPHALLHNLKHNKVLHERIILLTVANEEVPRVHDDQRLDLSDLGHGFWRVIVHFGFMEEPHVPHALELMKRHGIVLDLMETSFFLGRETIVPSVRPELKPWQERLFIVMARRIQVP
jgi:KUP system potassium uptake protein